MLVENPTPSSSQSSGQTSTAFAVKDPAEGSTNSSNQTVVEQVTEIEASQIVTDVPDSPQETPVRSRTFLCDYVLIVLYLSSPMRCRPGKRMHRPYISLLK